MAKIKLSNEFYTLDYSERKKLKEALNKINNFETKVKRQLNIYEGDGVIKTGFENVEALKKR